MTYNPSTDFVGLWRAISGGVQKAEMPGLDFVVAALGRAGLVNVSVSSTQPVANQSTTAWFQPASPSYAAEGALYLWNSGTSSYVAATPALFRQFLEASFGATGASWFTTTGGAPSNTVGSNGDFAIRTDSPGGIYGPKAGGAWPATPVPGTSYSQVLSAFDYAFGTTQGSVLFRGAATWQALAPGTSGYVLTTGGAGANPSWASAAAAAVNSSALDSAFGSTQGAILYRSATAWTTLAPGTSGFVLTTQGAGANPSWAAQSAASSAALDAAFGSTQGSILYRNATTWTTLAPGANGQFFQTLGASANPAWAAVTQLSSANLDSLFGATVGGVLIRSTTGWSNLGAGTSGYFLKSNGGGANPAWSPQVNPTAGSIGSFALGTVGGPINTSGGFYAGTWSAVSIITTATYGGTVDLYLYVRTA